LNKKGGWFNIRLKSNKIIFAFVKKNCESGMFLAKTIYIVVGLSNSRWKNQQILTNQEESL